MTKLNHLLFALLLIAGALSFAPDRAARAHHHQPPNEAALNKALAAKIGGRTEVRHYYFASGRRYYVRVDIETDSHVIEGGLDKRSSLDSIQQATFAAQLSGKKGRVIIYDSDGIEGPFEYRIRIAARALGIDFQRIPLSELINKRPHKQRPHQTNGKTR